MTSGRTLLIDGDILVYKAACVNERAYDFSGDGHFAVTADEAPAKAHIDASIRSLVSKNDASPIVCLTAPNNWRKVIYPAYKAQRANNRKPILLEILQRHLQETYPVKLIDTLEADDVMGILATRKGAGRVAIVTIDKDLRQIPGWHIHLDTGRKDKVTVEEGDRLFYTQALTGDVVDNYPGLPGCGPKTAAAILAQADEDGIHHWEAVVRAYLKKGYTRKDALVQAQVARICRATDYNFKDHHVLPFRGV